jgi:putative transposase
MKTYKYRLYPTKQQKQLLAETLESCRVLYNCALEQRKVAYRQFGVSVRRLDQQAELLEIKEYFPKYKGIHSQVLQEVIIWLVFKNPTGKLHIMYRIARSKRVISY